ncbi:hypothetical protein AGABI1DRAFT_79697 [Agaricus bisporus var. burnettii JB137-S8]|uniref:Zn(2)-C6 fungal-type domain-containing protein n=1 Tax=Agaricus bisporus var. burnettii (strain JB137-S8 / ATCC MYA-4627 / FGSC 10392) TaxID=597362 RepID=K5XLY7_AGABU|nr:uncharacterized protein AGABI1DRAFT_79697 [Agaricus bisporus var. burnettii JB137-S8]EKM75560.1 hypothetical protein AGABI1DRAFT_79697 [Agaricus bisporus var. burnettii JB137-S8]
MGISTVDTSIKPSPASRQSSLSLHYASSSSSPITTTTTSTFSSTVNGGSTSRNVPILPATQDASSAGLVKVESQTQGPKKRRIPGACDICKKKKIRCDSGEMSGNKCSNCIQYGYECTHKEVTKTLGPAKGYVESLEARLEKLDKLLVKLLPGVDLSQEVDKLLEEVEEPNDYSDDTTSIVPTVGKLMKLDLNPPEHRFFGKSSGYQLIQTALDLKSQYNGTRMTCKHPELKYRRPQFWDIPPYISFNPDTEDTERKYNFPPYDLIPSLVTLYFAHVNPFLPLLHRPTFERGITRGLHLTDSYFGATVLLVCALGSKYSDDPRVFVEGSNSTRSAGWHWYEQVRNLRSSFFARASLHELQAHVLFIIYSQSTEIPHGTWSQIGMALRLAQEVGAHRRRSGTPTAEGELWKRAFWVIVSMDRLTSSLCGRPCGLQDEDFDLDLPIECDDEYWESSNPEECFKQPAGQPSAIEFFNCHLSLMDILAYTIRTIYSVKRRKHNFGMIIQRPEQQIIAELDSAMNNWMDSVPQHLRWNPTCENQLFFEQSAVLHATYYHVQILIHRPFIPSPRNRPQVTFPSLAICTNAARSCCHVLESLSRRCNLPLPDLMSTTFIVAVILLLNIWSGKRTGFAPNPKREMEDVQRCMNTLESCEGRWSKAGRLRDILTELAYAGQVPIRKNTSPSPQSRKRRKTLASDMPILHAINTSHIVSDQTTTSRDTSPLNTFSTASTPVSATPPNFSLPMNSNELGRLPVYGQFKFSDSTVAVSHQESLSQKDREGMLSSTPSGPGSSAPTGYYSFQQSLWQCSPPSSPAPKLSTIASTETIANRTNPPMGVSGLDPEDPLVTNGTRSDGGSVTEPSSLLDNDAMTMWSTAPTGFELDEWQAYISSVNLMTRGIGPSI